jgi:pSer/pThr/pTyr-binding forkhead associated (FHA) protein
MPTLTLRHHEADLKAHPLAEGLTRIGRLPDNDIVIDHPGASSHHASVFRADGKFILEDLQSTNGTFVNGQRVSRCTLQHGDVIGIGQHQLAFSEVHEAAATTPSPEQAAALTQGETVFLDPQQHHRVLTIIRNGEERGTTPPEAAGPLGALRVLAGSADRPEYVLKSHTSLIGKASGSLIRLRGWFKPSVAVAITRNRTGYVATRLGGRLRVNGEAMNGRYDLKAGDVLSVCGLTLQFRMTDAGQEPAAKPDETSSRATDAA